MGLVAIGPVSISHGDPKFASSARSVGHGIRSLTIGGSCSWAAANTIEEMVANEDNRTTKAGHTGVLEWLEFDDALLGSRTGDYILEDFGIDADQESSLTTTDVSFTLVAHGPMP